LLQKELKTRSELALSAFLGYQIVVRVPGSSSSGLKNSEKKNCVTNVYLTYHIKFVSFRVVTSWQRFYGSVKHFGFILVRKKCTKQSEKIVMD